MELSPFRIERFYAQYEHSTRFMLSSSDCESRTIAELLELEPDAHGRLLEQRCGYTESPGAPALREAIASLYEQTSAEEVIVTSSRPISPKLNDATLGGHSSGSARCGRVARRGAFLPPGSVPDWS